MKLYQISEPNKNNNEDESMIHEQANEDLAIGIDLGTTNSAVALYDYKIGEVIIATTNDKGDLLLPSVVPFNVINNAPKIENQHNNQNEKVFRSMKRFMGKGSADLANFTQDIINLDLTVDLEGSSANVIKFIANDYNNKNISTENISTNSTTAVEISAKILKTLINCAEKAFCSKPGQKISKAVITVPAHFDEAARIATRNAARIAGIDVLRILNEPTAAAIAYGLGSSVDDYGKKYLVYDLGGGTFDVSILQAYDDVLKVIATAGDNHLGGDDFDSIILNYLEQHGYQFHEKQSKLIQAREIKEFLTKNDKWESSLSSSKQKIIIEKHKFVELSEELFKRTMNIVDAALNAACLSYEEIDKVVLVGGATKMPFIKDRLTSVFGNKLLMKIDPELAVVKGAAIQADALMRKSNHLLLDVVALSLGIELMGGVVEHIIHRNTTIPTEATRIYTTYSDNQTGFKLHIVQGEGNTVDKCRSLGTISLSDIVKMPAGQAKLVVKFMMDADGLLVVSAFELNSNKGISAEIKPSYGLDEEMIRQLIEASMRSDA